ncbi:uncharacterized protein LOC115752517 [Rhodamnia argentea]|uniref:Uncharacterized protein LOC115752517 n=1 Tax=Rhodamnia argentea TaxID=178133 RepID=A0A8B8QHR1_9MYRT|nr:uncharacterized protein LOC115752517 [Rhodamnia argentea]XP_030546595.1 uncharacterized protein LOC115752517 [Rhodamnia argentea]XP_048139135.1 uncharacterized protein LOC115752517 [Rhodamnia argentea]
MGSGGTADLTGDCEDFICAESVKKSHLLRVIDANQQVSEQIAMIGKEDRDNLGPNTPDTDREDGEVFVRTKCPPALPEMMLGVDVLDSSREKDDQALAHVHQTSSPHTPKDSIFDPFAPGPEDLLLAPRCDKRLDEWRSSVARRLKFGGFASSLEDRTHMNCSSAPSDEEIVDSVYDIIWEVVIVNRMEEVSASISGAGWDFARCNTPHSELLLNGIAETCPDAPMKSSMGSRNISLDTCKKLLF